ncbi:MAG: glycosyltransferase [Bacteroidales bacterium]|jgi:hypothetical protein|nr:glycosyltransferase [Bacteroidales bacterium]
MNILMIGENYENYLAKCHESWRDGFRKVFDAKSYGEGYPDYDSHDNYADVLKKTFPDVYPDWVIFYSGITRLYSGMIKIVQKYKLPVQLTQFIRKYKLPVEGMRDIPSRKAILLCDYWYDAYSREYDFVNFIKKNKVNYILSFFKQPIDRYNADIGRFGTDFKDIVWFPPSFNPAIFNDWHEEKKYDVGFLAAGTTTPNLRIYPERFELHTKLKNTSLKYLYAPHPGWGDFKDGHKLVGENFSRLINSCKIFITTGGIYNTFNPKYMEILASKSCLFATEPYDAESTGLIDGVNYVKIDTTNAIDKIYEYLKNESEIERIAENGYKLAMDNYSCYALAERFRQIG